MCTAKERSLRAEDMETGSQDPALIEKRRRNRTRRQREYIARKKAKQSPDEIVAFRAKRAADKRSQRAKKKIESHIVDAELEEKRKRSHAHIQREYVARKRARQTADEIAEENAKRAAHMRLRRGKNPKNIRVNEY